jgi:DNA-binding transcriptional regulator LsrR (DeoR family)
MLEKTPTRRGKSAAEASPGRVARNRMRIAWMYYVEGLTQNEIADRLGIGRVTVVRNINEAIRQREVKIWIEGDVAECLELEGQLKQAFGFKEAMVVPEPSNPALTTKAIGVAAGMYITDNLTDDMSIGVGWGATLYESLQTLAPRELENVQVISLLGGIVQARRYNPSEFAWQVARMVGADCYPPHRAGGRRFTRHQGDADREMRPARRAAARRKARSGDPERRHHGARFDRLPLRFPLR